MRHWWREQAHEKGSVGATSRLARNLWTFLRESTPAQRRQRFGDMEYDWENRVNTTSGTVDWRARLLGLLYSPYQPTEPALFRKMMATLPIDYEAFTFIDLGSGKGRTLLMASEYPFRRIVGVELLPALHQIAQENLARYKADSQKCSALETVYGDATNFSFPNEPLVLYLFNPLPESGLKQVMANLDRSLLAHPRAVYVAYHNPLLEHVLSGRVGFTKLAGTHQYSIYAFSGQTERHHS